MKSEGMKPKLNGIVLSIAKSRTQQNFSQLMEMGKGDAN
jgi:hypothetical protein